MMNNKFIASSPATFMIAGEHAVLYGGAALVGALNKRLYVSLQPRNDRKLIISSEFSDCYETTLDKLSSVYPYEFVLACCEYYAHVLPSGFNLQITSEFSHKIGFGSSAAVTVATLRVLQEWLGLEKTQNELFTEALKIIKKIQGMGSGADVAATIYGGIIYYRPSPVIIESLPGFYDFSLIYLGYKMSTVAVVQMVEQKKLIDPENFKRWFAIIADLTEQAKKALIDKKWQFFARLLQKQQDIFDKIGVTNKDINKITALCLKYRNVLAAKNSGSGLGDCILCLGKLPADTFPVTLTQKKQGILQFNLKLSREGVLTHEELESLMSYG